MSWRAKEIEKLKQHEFDNGIFSVDQSFHAEYAQCPWIIVRNLPYEYSEGDIMTIFEQYGTIISLELARSEVTGISKGTAIFSYENPKSAILAVDNLNGITLSNRVISVDHIKYVPNEKSHQTDPRQFVPARLRHDSKDNQPFFDEGSAASTESD